MSGHRQISEHHRQRLAYIYIRQSTLRQVAEHQESQDLQYQLATRARAMGWSEARIHIIDEDLGKSAVSSRGRSGFQRLFTDVGTGKVGILMVTDVSRLARNCADWYQLLDLAAHNDVLVCDSGGVYNPRAYDDRLLLGVKGAFSEAQWHIMRQQMQAARLNKAKRGELALRLPIGYERLANGEVIKSADQQVQNAVRLVFRHFRQQDSARGVLRRLCADNMQLPRRKRAAAGQPIVTWSAPSYQQVYQILKLPAYAGAYAYGKRRREKRPGKPGSHYGRRLPPEEWQVLLRDAFPAYISWQEYMRNQETLSQNWRATHFASEAGENPLFVQKGAVGKGRALLQGIVFCARCGRSMRVRYRDKPAYVCEMAKMQYNEPRCQYQPYTHVDQAVVGAFLDAVQPAALEVTLAALEEMKTQQNTLAEHWQQQLERARYDVDLAKARYEQVDPKMRLVAAELERCWEEALQQQQRLQQEWERFQAENLQPLSTADEALVRQLAHDLPELWSAETTSNADRKRLLRTLIADVTLESMQENGLTHIYVRWQTGAVSHLTAARPRPGHPSNPRLLERVRVLAEAGHNDEQIATTLNQEGLVSSWHVKDDAGYVPGQAVVYWNRDRVRHLRYKHKIRANPTAGGFVSVQTAAEEVGISAGVILDWFRRGLLPGRQERRGAPVWIQLDEAVRYRVSAQAPRDLPFTTGGEPRLIALAQAAEHFGLLPEQLTAALKAGRFATWRLEHGSQYRWYLQENEAVSAEPTDPLPK